MPTSVEVNEDAAEFMFKFVAATLAVTVIGTDFVPSIYACRPCFAKFEKGSRQYKHTILLISKLQAAARATGSIEVTLN